MKKLLFIGLLVLLGCQEYEAEDLPKIPEISSPTIVTYDYVFSATLEELREGVYINADNSVTRVGDYSATWDLLFYLTITEGNVFYSVRTMGFGSDQGSVYSPAISLYLNVLSAGTWSTQDFDAVTEQDCTEALEERTEVQRFKDFSQTTTCYSTSNGNTGKLALAPGEDGIAIRIAQFN